MSGLFDLNDDELEAQRQRAESNLADISDQPVPVWQGMQQQGKRLMAGSASASRTIGMSLAPVAMLVDKAANVGDWVGGFARDRPEWDPGPKALNATDWWFEHAVDGVGQNTVDYWTPDAQTNGKAANVLGTVFDVVGRVPQMVGTPGVFLTDAAMSPGTEVVRAGGSTQAALGTSGVSLVANAVGMRMPAAFGSTLATRVATGAGANVAVGGAQNLATQNILEADGLDQLAASYDPLNPQSLLLDGLMGAGFGLAAHAGAPRMTTAQREAVLTARNADHFANRTLPGEPLTTAAGVAHQDALGDAIRQVLAGESVNVEGRVSPGLFDLRPELHGEGFEAAIAGVLRTEGGYVNDPSDHGGETNFGISKRANPDVDVANLTEAKAKAIYRERYWKPINADALPAELQQVAFDAAVNQGVGWTKKALAKADGDPAKFIALREARYREIVAADPTQAKFLRGWINRLGKFRETSDAGIALRERLVKDPEQLALDYAALPDSNGGRVLNTDTARELSPEYLADRTRSADVHEAASDTIKTIYETKLAQPTPEGLEPVVMFTAGGTGAGKTTAINAAGEALGKPEIVYDTNMNTLSSAVDKVEQALAAGREVRIAYVYRDPVEALTAGALPRAQRQAKKFGTGRTVPLREHAKTHAGVRGVMDAIAERYAGDPRVSLIAIDNSKGRGKQEIVELASLPKVEEDSLRERLSEALEAARAAGLDESLYQGFRAGEGQARPEVGAGDGGRTPQGDDGKVSPAETPLDAAKQLAAESPDTHVIDGFDADGNPRYRPLTEALADIEAERAQAEADARAFPAAVNCFLRRGGDAS